MLRDLFFTSRCFALTAGSSRLKEAAKRAFDALGGKPIPKVAQLSEQYAALLAEALARERGLTGLPAIAAGANGKPFFPDRPDLQFNLSHSHGAAVCALHHLPIGVDVERLRPAPRRLSRGMDDGDFSACGRRRRPPSSAGPYPAHPALADSSIFYTSITQNYDSSVTLLPPRYHVPFPAASCNLYLHNQYNLHKSALLLPSLCCQIRQPSAPQPSPDLLITAEGSKGVDLGVVRPGEGWTVVNATADTLRLARKVSNAKSLSRAAAPAAANASFEKKAGQTEAAQGRGIWTALGGFPIQKNPDLTKQAWAVYTYKQIRGAAISGRPI